MTDVQQLPEEKIYDVSDETRVKEKPNRTERRRAEREALKAAKQRMNEAAAQLPYSYVLLKDGRQVELRRTMGHLKALRRAKEPIIMAVEGGKQKIAIPWESVAKISSKQF